MEKFFDTNLVKRKYILNHSVSIYEPKKNNYVVVVEVNKNEIFSVFPDFNLFTENARDSYKQLIKQRCDDIIRYGSDFIVEDFLKYSFCYSFTFLLENEGKNCILTIVLEEVSRMLNNMLSAITLLNKQEKNYVN